MQKFLLSLPAALVAAATIHAAQECPVSTVIDAGCVGSSGEKPTITVSGSYATNNLPVELVVDHTSNLANVAVIGGSVTSPTIFGGNCTLITPATTVFFPLSPDTNGQSRVALPIDLAIVGAQFGVQAAEWDPAAPSGWAISDGLALDFDPGCASAEALVAVMLNAPISTGAFLTPEEVERAEEARAAYLALFDMGAEAIGPLAQALANLPPSSQGLILHGIIPQHTAAGVLPFSGAEVAVCYLMESIYRGHLYPWGEPLLMVEGTSDFLEDLDVAADIYYDWAVSASGLDLPSIQAGPSPLDGSGITWRGGLRVSTLFLLVPSGGDGMGTEVPGSKTPLPSGPPNVAYLPGGPPDSQGVFNSQGQDSGAYNCQSWAIYGDSRSGCVQPVDATQPTNPPTYRPGTFLEAMFPPGWSASEALEPGCVKVYFHTSSGDEPAGKKNFVHSFRYESDNILSCKNGPAGGLWTGTTDCGVGIMDRFYPLKPGQLRVSLLYCPPQ